MASTPVSGSTPPPKNNLWHFSRGIAFASSSVQSGSSPLSVEQVVRTTSMGRPVNASAAPTSKGRVTRDESGKAATEASAGSAVKEAETAANGPGKSDASLASAETSTDEQDKPQTEHEAARTKPPPPVLDYTISEETFSAAKKAAPGSPESFWSYELYRGPPDANGRQEKVKVHYCRSKHTMERVCQEYFMDEKVIGFDLEWMPDSMKWQGPRKNVSLIQIASPSRVALFHTAIFSEKDLSSIGPTFKQIMEDPDVLKCGVAIKGDATRLKTHFQVECQGLMELSHLYKLVTFSRRGDYKAINRRLVTLATQVEEFLHLPLYKGQDVRASNWSKPLTWQQVAYSASDAYAGPHLFATLEHCRKQLNPCPPRPHPAETNLPIRTGEGLEIITNDETLMETANDDAPCDDTLVSDEFVNSVFESVTIEEDADEMGNVSKSAPNRGRIIRPPSTGMPRRASRDF